VDVRLTKGSNLFLIKVANRSGGWEVILRLTDLQGNPLQGVEYAAGP